MASRPTGWKALARSSSWKTRGLVPRRRHRPQCGESPCPVTAHDDLIRSTEGARHCPSGLDGNRAATTMTAFRRHPTGDDDDGVPSSSDRAIGGRIFRFVPPFQSGFRDSDPRFRLPRERGVRKEGKNRHGTKNNRRRKTTTDRR